MRIYPKRATSLLGDAAPRTIYVWHNKQLLGVLAIARIFFEILLGFYCFVITRDSLTMPFQILPQILQLFDKAHILLVLFVLCGRRRSFYVPIRSLTPQFG